MIEATALPCGAHLTPVGSRITCVPAPTNTDQDWLVLIDPTQYEQFAQSLLGGGWQVGGSMIPAEVDTTPPSARFNSFTKGDDNIIATTNPKFHKRFLAATSVAKRLNLLDKADRVALFQAVLYGNGEAPQTTNELNF